MNKRQRKKAHKKRYNEKYIKFTKTRKAFDKKLAAELAADGREISSHEYLMRMYRHFEVVHPEEFLRDNPNDNFMVTDSETGEVQYNGQSPAEIECTATYRIDTDEGDEHE